MSSPIEEARAMLEEMRREIDCVVQLLDRLEAAPKMPDLAKERMNKKLCLECGKKLGTDTRRGCHEACYRRIIRAIERHTYSESDAIARGKLAPRQGGGRAPEPTSLERELAREE